MVVGFSCLTRGSVGEFLGHHDAGTDDCARSEAYYARGQRVGTFALFLQVGRGIAVERRRVVNLHLLADGQLEEDIRLGTANAGMPDRDRPYSNVVEALDGAISIRSRTLAAEFVEAVALSVVRVAIGLGESSGVEMRTPLAMLVNLAAISELTA